jgi:hypothetical protein
VEDGQAFTVEIKSIAHKEAEQGFFAASRLVPL